MADFYEPHCPFWDQNGQCGLVISTGYRICDSVLYRHINRLVWPDPIFVSLICWHGFAPFDGWGREARINALQCPIAGFRGWRPGR